MMDLPCWATNLLFVELGVVAGMFLSWLLTRDEVNQLRDVNGQLCDELAQVEADLDAYRSAETSILNQAD